jgi:parallel beta-helix repeat protein
VHRSRLAVVLLVAWLIVCSCGAEGRVEGDDLQVPEAPSFDEPAEVYLADTLEEMCAGDAVVLGVDTEGARFTGCQVRVAASGISIRGCEFVGAPVLIESVSSVLFADNVVRDYRVYEEPAVVVGNCSGVTVRHNHVHDNAVGIGVGESQAVVVENNLFELNYQHNALALYKSSAQVSGNVFRYNYPHGILVHYVPESGGTSVSITGNLFEMNVEDAVNFEDWTGARDVSRVAGNVIYRTNWAGINVEYNSWNANILVEGNYVSESGYPKGHFPQSLPHVEEWSDGWQHGIKLEDSSVVTVTGNVLVHNAGSGIDVGNCRDVTLAGNTIVANGVGVRIGGPTEGAFTRDVSPLLEGNAGPSVVACVDNDVRQNGQDFVGEQCD